MSEQLYDVVAVNQDDSSVRMMGSNKTKENAEALVKLCVMRRGLYEDFFVEVPAGKFKDGDIYTN